MYIRSVQIIPFIIGLILTRLGIHFFFYLIYKSNNTNYSKEWNNKLNIILNNGKCCEEIDDKRVVFKYEDNVYTVNYHKCSVLTYTDNFEFKKYIGTNAGVTVTTKLIKKCRKILKNRKIKE